MRRRHQGRAPGEPGQARRDDTAPRRDAAAAAVLALQGSAGNRAVGALLARAPADAPGRSAPAEGAARVTLGDMGTITVESVQLAPSRGGGSVGSGRGEPEKPPVGPLIITSKVGPHSPALLKASTDGKVMSGRVEFRGSEARLELTNAIVASYHVSAGGDGQTESWTIDAESIEHFAPQPDTGEP